MVFFLIGFSSHSDHVAATGSDDSCDSPACRQEHHESRVCISVTRVRHIKRMVVIVLFPTTPCFRACLTSHTSALQRLLWSVEAVRQRWVYEAGRPAIRDDGRGCPRGQGTSSGLTPYCWQPLPLTLLATHESSMGSPVGNTSCLSQCLIHTPWPWHSYCRTLPC
jgi:hypothetical protein